MIILFIGLDVNFKGYSGNSPIHLARQRLDALQLILKNGGDLTLKNDSGLTCFVRACANDNFEMVKFIHMELVKRFEGTELLQDELREGFIHAINCLKIKNIEYLARFIESKELMNIRRVEILVKIFILFVFNRYLFSFVN